MEKKSCSQYGKNKIEKAAGNAGHQIIQQKLLVCHSFMGGIILAFASMSAFAMDCKNPVETFAKLVCKNKDLAAADESMNYIYKAAIARSSQRESIKQEQRAWIQNKQSKCSSVACLSRGYSIRTGELLNSLTTWCSAQKGLLHGAWVRKGDGGFFEEFLANPDGRFDSWANHRPDLSGGRWNSNGCSFEISSQDGSLAIGWIVLEINKSVLKVLEVDSATLSTYQRVLSN